MAGEDPEYLAWIRSLVCCLCGSGRASEPHHTGRKGTSQRSHDHKAIPLCLACHRHRHALSGPVKGWDEQRVRDFENAQVEHYRLLYTEDVF